MQKLLLRKIKYAQPPIQTDGKHIFRIGIGGLSYHIHGRSKYVNVKLSIDKLLSSETLAVGVLL